MNSFKYNKFPYLAVHKVVVHMLLVIITQQIFYNMLTQVIVKQEPHHSGGINQLFLFAYEGESTCWSRSYKSQVHIKICKGFNNFTKCYCFPLPPYSSDELLHFYTKLYKYYCLRLIF